MECGDGRLGEIARIGGAGGSNCRGSRHNAGCGNRQQCHDHVGLSGAQADRRVGFADGFKVLWDPANSLYCAEVPFPDGYDALRGGYLGHVHIKDVVVEIAKATVTCKELGSGHLGPYLPRIAAALREDGYEGAISLESVYRPLGGTFEDGFRASIGRFLELFG